MLSPCVSLDERPLVSAAERDATPADFGGVTAEALGQLGQAGQSAAGNLAEVGLRQLNMQRETDANNAYVIGADDVLHAEVEEFALPPWWKLLWQRWFHRHQRPGILSILLRSGMVNAEAASLERRAHTSLLLTPPLHDVELLDWKAYERAIDAGYTYAQKLLGRANAPRELP